MYWRASSHIHSLVITFLDMAYILFRARHAPYPNLIRGYGISVGRLFRIWRACILHAFMKEAPVHAWFKIASSKEVVSFRKDLGPH